MWDYSDKVKDHFFHPRNVGTIENPDGVGEVGSLACGDALKLMFKLDKNRRIADIKFHTFGCGSAIASSSALTELVRGKTLEEAEKITNQDIADYLGGLPEQKMHCSVMGKEALEAAIENYRTGKPVSRAAESKIICTCFGVTEGEIAKVIRENELSTVEEVTNYCKAGGGCGGCHADIEAILQRLGAKKPTAADESDKAATRPKQLTNIKRIQLVQEIIARQIRPALQRDGGDIELVDIEGTRVIVALRGMCSQCPAAGVTLEQWVQAKLREFVDEKITVEEAPK
ncbi:MAG: Fe-S cluster assembly protein NifU [Actinobacteria bacterium]|nr:Fe-S cluster assembly protein NifU [Actinomycetota bacterium]